MIGGEGGSAVDDADAGSGGGGDGGVVRVSIVIGLRGRVTMNADSFILKHLIRLERLLMAIGSQQHDAAPARAQ